MKYIDMKKSRKTSLIISIIFLVFLAAALWKIYYDIYKITCFNNGEEYYVSGRFVKAEEWFQRARSYGLFEYKDDYISNRLDDLKYVTDLKSSLKSTCDSIKRAYGLKDTKSLISLYNSYMVEYGKAVKVGDASKPVFLEISEGLGIEDTFETYFKKAIDDLKAEADAAISNKSFDNEGFMDNLVNIPSEYFGGEDKKKTEIEAFIKDYDNRKIDILASSDISLTLAQASNIIAFDKKYSFNYSWIIDKMESVWMNAVKKDISASDFTSLYKHYSEYKSFIAKYKSKSGVLGTVDSFITTEYKQAMEFSDSHKFKEALDLLAAMGSFKDTKQDINDIKLKWILDDPVYTLNGIFTGENIRNVYCGTNLWNERVYLLGYKDYNIYFARVDESFQYVKTQYTVYGAASGIKSLRIMKELDYNGPVIVAEVESPFRKSQYIGLSLQGDKLTEIFKFDADGFSAAGNDRLIVDNPTGAGAGKRCYFTYSDGYFGFSEIKI